MEDQQDIEVLRRARNYRRFYTLCWPETVKNSKRQTVRKRREGRIFAKLITSGIGTGYREIMNQVDDLTYKSARSTAKNQGVMHA